MKLTRENVERQLAEMWQAIGDCAECADCGDGTGQAARDGMRTERELRDRLAAQERLEAAAPDLLTALREVVRCLGQHIADEAAARGIPPERVCPCTEFQLKEARAAIAKATGNAAND